MNTDKISTAISAILDARASLPFLMNESQAQAWALLDDAYIACLKARQLMEVD